MTILTQRIQKMSLGGALCLGVLIFHSDPAQAVPIKNADKCQGPVTIGVATCPDKPGHWVECTGSGDYMCCVEPPNGGEGLRTNRGYRIDSHRRGKTVPGGCTAKSDNESFPEYLTFSQNRSQIPNHAGRGGG